MYIFSKSSLLAHTDCTSLPSLLSTLRKVHNVYGLSLQQYLILANFQEPFRLTLRSPENNLRTQLLLCIFSTFNTTSLCLAGRLESLAVNAHRNLSLESMLLHVENQHHARDSRYEPWDSPGLSSQESEGGGAERHSNKSSETLHLYKYLLI